MCNLTVWYYPAKGCGHSLMFRNFCNIGNPSCCEIEECEVEREVAEDEDVCYLCDERHDNERAEAEKRVLQEQIQKRLRSIEDKDEVKIGGRDREAVLAVRALKRRIGDLERQQREVTMKKAPDIKSGNEEDEKHGVKEGMRDRKSRNENMSMATLRNEMKEIERTKEDLRERMLKELEAVDKAIAEKKRKDRESRYGLW